MINVYLHGPKWFLGVAGGLETFSAFIALLVALVACKILWITKERKYLYFTTSFVLLTLSFLARGLTDLLLQGVLLDFPEKLAPYLFLGGYVSHIILALTAYIMLIIITHKIEDKRVMALIFAMLLPTLFFSGSYFRSFYVLSFIFLSFVTFAYFQNYRKVCSGAACLVFIAFFLITIAQALFLLERLGDSWYIGAHAVHGIGYFMLLSALVRAVLRSPVNKKTVQRKKR